MQQIIPLDAFKDNYIWLIQQEKSVWVIDPGDARPVLDYLDQKTLNLAGILLTHHHADHSGGIDELLNEFAGVPVYGCVHSHVKSVSHFVKENDHVRCGQITLKVAEIPGHTLDHIAFYNDEMIFSGDTLFSAGCGRVFEGTHEQMYHSLNKLSQMASAAKIYCGHEYTLQNLKFAEFVEPNNLFIQKKMRDVIQILAQGQATLPGLLDEEKKINPFLRCREKSVRIAVEKYVNHALSDPLDVFKSLREWKNHF